MIGWAESSKDKTPTHLYQNPILPPLPQFPSRGKDVVNGDEGTGGRGRKSGVVGGGGIGVIFLSSPSRRSPLLPAWTARDTGVGGSGGLGRRTE